MRNSSFAGRNLRGAYFAQLIFAIIDPIRKTKFRKSDFRENGKEFRKCKKKLINGANILFRNFLKNLLDRKNI